MLTLQHCDDERFLVVCAHCSVCQTFTGYAFLLFQDESSVQALIDACIQEDGKLYLCVSSPTIKDKPVSMLFCDIISNTEYYRSAQVVFVLVSDLCIPENCKVQYSSLYLFAQMRVLQQLSFFSQNLNEQWIDNYGL